MSVPLLSHGCEEYGGRTSKGALTRHRSRIWLPIVYKSPHLKKVSLCNAGCMRQLLCARLAMILRKFNGVRIIGTVHQRVSYQDHGRPDLTIGLLTMVMCKCSIILSYSKMRTMLMRRRAMQNASSRPCRCQGAFNYSSWL